MRIRDFQRLIRGFSIEQKRALGVWLQDLIVQEDRKERRRSQVSKREASQGSDHRTYRRVSIRCGKEGCKCNEGKLHGPYWYAYWSEQGKTRSQYIGKKLPKRKPRSGRST